MENFIFAGTKLKGERIREEKIEGVKYVWLQTKDGTKYPIKKSQLTKNQ
jgi:hypothetical protein